MVSYHVKPICANNSLFEKAFIILDIFNYYIIMTYKYNIF